MGLMDRLGMRSKLLINQNMNNLTNLASFINFQVLS